MATKSKGTIDALTKTTKPVRSRDHIAHIEHFVQTVDNARSGADWEIEAARIADEMQSDEAEIRARAVRKICPCKMPWPVFNRLRKAAKRLQHDPDPKVAANARHIEVDATQVMTMEGSLERIRERMEIVDEEVTRSSLKRRRE